MEKKQTLFEELLDDYFLKNIENETVPETQKCYLKGEFYISASSEKNKIYKYYFELKDHYIICHKDQSSPEIAYMDVKHAFIKYLEPQILKVDEGKKVYGIKFVKKKVYEELFCESEAQAKAWFEKLKMYCVLSKFRYFFSSKKVIGKGNFAKVFLVERKANKDEYAAKIFDKNLIMSDPMEKKCLLYEISMMREMNHHRVCKLYELYEGENYIYCLNELYSGSTLLDAIIKKGFQPEKKSLKIISNAPSPFKSANCMSLYSYEPVLMPNGFICMGLKDWA